MNKKPRKERKEKPRRWKAWAVALKNDNYILPAIFGFKRDAVKFKQKCLDFEVIKVTIVEQLPTPTKKDNR